MKIVPGNVFGFWLFLAASAVVIYIMNLSEKGKLTSTLRPIPGLGALEEAVGRATEMGKPVHFSPGLGDVIGASAPETLAALQLLSHVTELSARYDAKLMVTIRMPNVFPIAQELVRGAYMAANKIESYKEDTVRYVSDDQDAYAAGVIGLMHQEKVASSILAGLYMGEALLIAESGASLGMMQVAVTASVTQIPFFVAACDYVIIGEELYAAGAYVSGNRMRIGAIAAQDRIKLVMMAIIVLGTIATSLGSRFVQDLLTK